MDLVTKIRNIDVFLTDLINAVIPHNPVLDYFFSFFSLKGNSIFIWIAVIIFVLIFEERKNPGISKKDIKFIADFLIAVFLASLISQVIIKNIVQRARPCSHRATLSTASFNAKLPDCLRDYSFPSSHATTSFAAAAVITAFDKKRRWFYYLTALLISLSRIYLGYHYFFDVFAGGITGWIVGLLTLKYIRQFPKFAKKAE